MITNFMSSDAKNCEDFHSAPAFYQNAVKAWKQRADESGLTAILNPILAGTPPVAAEINFDRLQLGEVYGLSVLLSSLLETEDRSDKEGRVYYFIESVHSDRWGRQSDEARKNMRANLIEKIKSSLVNYAN